MKRFLLFTLLLGLSLTGYSQFGTAHDFTVTDIDGGEHHLYSILEDNKIVIVDVSATWCGPCWSNHQAHILEDVYKALGPGGDDILRVIFYEGDANTTSADLNGTGSNTYGNWVEGTTYPIVNESPLQLNLNVYAPQGFPTVNIIRPSDQEIVEDAWNWDAQAIIDRVRELAEAEGISGVKDYLSDKVSLRPNPVVSEMTISTDLDVSQAKVINVMGQQVKAFGIDAGETEINLNDLDQGVYFLHLFLDGDIQAVKKFSKL